ncbi:hypothetical protein B0H12DRAFT_1166123 [Mycena haematopus]|nr:hypothetical protein B0H12DRAFT_1166123 [Mycena haematopus]
MLGRGTDDLNAHTLVNRISGGLGGSGGEGHAQGIGGRGGVGQGPTVHQYYNITAESFTVNHQYASFATIQASQNFTGSLGSGEGTAAALSAAQEATIGVEQNTTEIVEAGTQDLNSYLALSTKNQARGLHEKPVQSHEYSRTESKDKLGRKLDLTFIMVGAGEGIGVRNHQQVCKSFSSIFETALAEIKFKILLTLTPAHVSARGARFSQHPLAWKVFDFEDNTQKVGWNAEFGFATVVQDIPDVDTPDFTCVVEPSGCAILNQNSVLGPSGKLQSSFLTIGVQNKSGVLATLVLCSVEAIHPDHNQYCPILELRDIENNALVECELPLQLQAYVVSNYQEGQILKPEDQYHCLFLDARGCPQPLDISQLLSIPFPTFHLKAQPTGGIILDKPASSVFQM